MPSLTKFATDTPLKMLVIGAPGAGKTGALTSLAKAGYTLRIADFDKGLDVLAEQLRDDPEALNRVFYKTYADDIKGNRVVAKAAAQFAKDLDNESEIGPAVELDKKNVLVIDSLTALSKSVMFEVLKLAGQSKARIQDWGEATERLERVIAKLCSPEVGCHVIILAHMIEDTGEGGHTVQYWPRAVTKNQSKDIGRFFNTVVMVKRSGSGKSIKRVIVSKPQPLVDLKCPFQVPDEIPISEGYLPFVKARS